ncbi:MAG: hypothetical protein GY716_05700 [bacterium]|nr:hypothetical protein [bacterium]
MRSSTASVQAPRGGFHPLRVGALFVAAAALTLLIPFAQHATVYAVVAGMAFLFVAPIWYQWQRGQLDAFETIHIIGFLQLIYFGVGAIWAVNGVTTDKFLVGFVPLAAIYCMIGYAAMLAGYFGPWIRRRPAPRFEELPRGTYFIAIPAAFGFVGNLALAALDRSFWMGRALVGLESSLAQLHPLFNFAWALACMLMLSGRASPKQRRFFWLVMLPATALLFVMQVSDKSLMMTFGGIPIIALWYARHRIPWATLLTLLLILIFVVFPFFNTYREIDPRLGAKQRITMTADVIKQWDGEKYLDRSIGLFQFRMALITSVAVIVRDCGRWVPYQRGEKLFLNVMATFIPRFIWPNKPVERTAREFGETFRVVHILDKRTNPSVTVPGELYWNFHLPGIIVGMALWGLAMRLLYRRYGEAEALDPVRRAVHILVLIQFGHFGGGLVHGSVTLIRTLILLEAYFWVARRLELQYIRPVDEAEKAVDEPDSSAGAAEPAPASP